MASLPLLWDSTLQTWTSWTNLPGTLKSLSSLAGSSSDIWPSEVPETALKLYLNIHQALQQRADGFRWIEPCNGDRFKHICHISCRICGSRNSRSSHMVVPVWQRGAPSVVSPACTFKKICCPNTVPLHNLCCKQPCLVPAEPKIAKIIWPMWVNCEEARVLQLSHIRSELCWVTEDQLMSHAHVHSHVPFFTETLHAVYRAKPDVPELRLWGVWVPLPDHHGSVCAGYHWNVQCAQQVSVMLSGMLFKKSVMHLRRKLSKKRSICTKFIKMFQFFKYIKGAPSEMDEFLEKNVSKNVAWLRGQYPFKEGLLILFISRSFFGWNFMLMNSIRLSGS